ncbi:MAG: bifunctional riboflavin kinase/FAD synthetase [Thermoanaerobaculia bacterium]|nr:bifunctional riboflavin kinase/FAD synthetase [Thermoanaerobaculia bacterium]
MIVFTDPLRESDMPRGGVVTIGNFDGMHVGHQEIIRRVVERAESLGVPSVLVTFHPHPLSVVAPDRVPRQIITLAQKEELLANSGLTAMAVIPFTPEFSRWTASRFIDDLLVARLGAREVHVGSDFCFGAGREGTLELLTARGRELGFEAHRIDDIRTRGIRVSSSIVRNAVTKGALRTARLALGRSYFVDGRVATGRRLGRRLGFPTVNLDPYNDLFPGSGVYVTTCRFDSFSRGFESVTNIGVRPTLYENYAVTIESHILDFDSNVYEDEVRVYFHQLLRRERRFQSALELTNQIRRDIEQTRLWFLRHPGL